MPHDTVIAAHIDSFSELPGGLLPLLHAIQKDLGYIPPSSIDAIARGMNLSRAEVHGVISFYVDFHTKPHGRHVLQICRAEACQAAGVRELEAHAKQSLGLDYGETSTDGQLTLLPVYCLGNCACSPSVRIDDDVHARVDPSRLDDLLAQLPTGEGR